MDFCTYLTMFLGYILELEFYDKDFLINLFFCAHTYEEDKHKQGEGQREKQTLH